MAVEIKITKRKREYINPQTNEKLSGLQRGVVTASDLGKGGEVDSPREGDGETKENKKK